MLLRHSYGVLFLMFLTANDAQGIINEGPSNVTYFPGQTPLPIELICNVTGFPSWRVDNITRTLDDLMGGRVAGHSANGPNILINIPVNDTNYTCLSNTVGAPAVPSLPAFLYVADAPNQVPDVAVDADSVALNDDNVTLTLSWGEPFNNFDPIVNYTVSCSGDVTCPLNFTTTDNTTRSYTITNLTSMTNYTFSVVATNSIGSGEAGVVMITAPSLPGNVTEVVLMCKVMDLINQCTADWNPITVGNGPLEQPLVYEVYYNGTSQNVTSPTTTLTFKAPSLPDGVFNDSVIVTVTAINRFGRGQPSDPDYDEILSSSVTNATIIAPENPTSTTYSINVTCYIHSDSDADICVVTARLDGQITQTTTGVAEINEMRMAKVIVDNLMCGRMYTIVAEGRVNNIDQSVGPGFFVKNITSSCPPPPTTAIAPTTSMTATPTEPAETPTTTVIPTRNFEESTGSDDNTGAVVGGVVGGIVAAIIIIIIIILLVWCCIKHREKSSRPTSPGDRVGFRPASGVKVQTLDRYGKPVPSEGDNADTGVELTGYTSKSPELTVTQIPSSTVTSTGQSSTFQGNEYEPAPSDEKNRTPSAFMPEGSYDTLAPADEPPVPSAQVIPPAQNGQSNPSAPKLNYAELEQFTRKPASVKKPEPQPSSQYAVIDPKSLQPGTYT